MLAGRRMLLLTVTQDPKPNVLCGGGRHADELLSETEQRIQQLKDLPPEAQTAAKEGFKQPHAPHKAQDTAKEGFESPQAQREAQSTEKEGAQSAQAPHDSQAAAKEGVQGPQALREAAQRAEE